MRDIWSLLSKQALYSEQIRSSRHAAAIVYKGMVLAYGHNSMKSHPIMLEYGTNPEAIYLHAEMDAIVRCINQWGNQILEKCDLYVLRLNKSGNTALSRPCSKCCARAIKAFKIRRVFHT